MSGTVHRVDWRKIAEHLRDARREASGLGLKPENIAFTGQLGILMHHALVMANAKVPGDEGPF